MISDQTSDSAVNPQQDISTVSTIAPTIGNQRRAWLRVIFRCTGSSTETRAMVSQQLQTTMAPTLTAYSTCSASVGSVYSVASSAT